MEKAKKARFTLEVKRGIQQLGTGKSAVVRVVLYDKSKYYGYMTEIKEDYFTIADAKTGNKAEIAYPEVKGVKGNNSSSAAKVGISVAIATAIAVIIAVIANGKDGNETPFDPRCGTIQAPCP